jgi:hypothetical protein
MRAKRLIPAALIILLAIGGLLLFFNTPSNSRPTLVFNGYQISATNTNAIAKLELRNTTGRTIWLRYSGSVSPFSPPFLEQPTVVPPTNVARIFFQGKKVLPGDSLRLEFPLRSGEPARLVGLIYYFGKFSDGIDFLQHMRVPALDSRANLKVKVAFYWQKFRRRFEAPERHEIWCNDLLSFQDAITNSPPPEPALVK